MVFMGSVLYLCECLILIFCSKRAKSAALPRTGVLCDGENVMIDKQNGRTIPKEYTA
jgi:hypothetical protein